MVKGEPIDVFKILKVMGIALVMIFWYPPSIKDARIAAAHTCHAWGIPKYHD